MSSPSLQTEPNAAVDPASDADQRLKARLPLWVGGGIAAFAVLMVLALMAHRTGVPVLQPGHKGPAAFHSV
jgi:hypothetical protein